MKEGMQRISNLIIVEEELFFFFFFLTEVYFKLGGQTSFPFQASVQR